MPTLYLMFGYPGAGKTTAAKLLQELTGAVRLSSDEVRIELFSQPKFNENEHIMLYQALDQRTTQLLAEGRDVIYDANLNRYQHRKDKYNICKQVGATAKLLWVQTPRNVAQKRAMHESRTHLIPQHESAQDMFRRIADVIEEPLPDEPYLALNGTQITADYIADTLDLA